MPRQTKVIIRNGTYSEWSTGSKYLDYREIVFESDSNLLKIGNSNDISYGLEPYLGDFGVRSLSSDYTQRYPENYSNTSTTSQTLSYTSTSTRVMHLIPFEIKDKSSFYVEVNQTGTLAGSFMVAIYNSDEYGRPYSLVTKDGAIYGNGLEPSYSTFLGSAGVNAINPYLVDGTSYLKKGLYWLGMVGYEITTTGNVTAYTGNDTYIHPTTSSGTIASTGHYSSYIVNLPYQSGSFNYGTVNGLGSKTFIITNTALTTNNLTLDGSYAVFGGFKVGDNVVIYSTNSTVGSDGNYAYGTITALGTPTGSYNITVNITEANNPSNNTNALVTKNIIIEESDWNRLASYPYLFAGNGLLAGGCVLPAILSTSHLYPVTTNAPLLRLI